MKIDGSCHCGAIAYEADADPDQVAICHCTDCQTLSGGAFRVLVYVPEARFRLLKGTPKIYVKTAESGRRRAQAFCPDCGVPLYSTGEESPKTIAIRAGTSRQRAQLAPKRQFWRRSALPWVPEMEGMERFERQ